MYARVLAVVLLTVLVTATPSRAEEEKPAPQPEKTKDAYVPRTFAPSWRDAGEAAYGRKDYADAIFHYRRWLEADPKDESTWYNLACCYALAGNGEKALGAFEAAVDAGWSDAEHPQRDTDVVTVREHARFKAALVRCVEAKDKDGPKGFVRHWVKIPALGSYIVALPPGYAESKETYPLVVILHGNGSNELNHGRLADKAGREGVIFIVPRAPYPHQQIFTGMGRPGWTWRPQDATEDAMEAFDPAARYVDSIIACVDDAKKRYRVQGERFYVFGHSMGGFFANTTAVLHPQRVAAYFAYAGGLAEELQDSEWLKPLATHGVKAWIVHGKADTVVPPKASEDAFKLLTASGVKANLHLFDDVTHGVGKPVLALLQSWLKTIVRAGAQLEK